MADPRDQVMTRSAAIEARRMYALRDSRGRRVWSCMRLAREFFVSETTMYRVLNGMGSYTNIPDAPLTEAAIDAGVEASKLKLLRMLGEEAPAGMLEQVEQTAAEKMAAAVKAEREKAGRGDALLDELVNQKGKEE